MLQWHFILFFSRDHVRIFHSYFCTVMISIFFLGGGGEAERFGAEASTPQIP